MNRYSCLLILAILILGNSELFSQKEPFIVKRVSFSSGIDDEFSPVFYKDGIVFCSNKRDNSLIVFKGDESRLFNMFYTAARGKNNWIQPSLFSKELKTGLNAGPATFNPSGNIMYFNRNNHVVNGIRNVSDTTNKLGIFSAEKVNGIWSGVKPFSRNDPSYTFCTPSITSDGKRIYFSSDMPGGFGGMDLYYCDSLDTGWSPPVNLGPVLNTPKNESFPFAAVFGKLYFSSDGHEGFGGKDIYYSLELNGQWINPVHLDSALNSPFDDFGIIADSSFSKGYFSSNRLKTDDIFSFSLAPEEFTLCDTLLENNYCFTFFDERHRLSDTAQLIYSWDFGNGIVKKGEEVNHCFPGPGKYSVSLSIFDKLTRDTISNRVKYNLNLEEKDQPCILAPNTGFVRKQINYNGIVTGLKDFRISGVFWDFGKGFIPGGEKMTMSFPKEGEYTIRLGLTGEKDSLGNSARLCVMRKIRIYGSSGDAEQVKGKEDKGLNTETDPQMKEERILKCFAFLMKDLSGNQKNMLKDKLAEINGRTLVFKRDGLTRSSEYTLPVVADILNNDSSIRLEIIVHSIDPDAKADGISLSGGLAGELGFRLRSLKVSDKQVGFTGSDSLTFSFGEPALDNHDDKEGFVEFIFMKK